MNQIAVNRKTDSPLDSVPIIDVDTLYQAVTRREIDRACREWGFFQVIGHGIPMETFSNLQEQMKLFFAQSKAEKHRILRTLDNPWGYYDQELTRNTLDWKEIYDYGPAYNPEVGGDVGLAPQWPRGLPRFQPAILAFYSACEKLAFRLLETISLNLGMPLGYLNREFKGGHSSFLRLNHYPVCPKPEHPEDASEPVDGFLGLNRHTDAGALTILLQDRQPGLEVFNEGRWHLVQPIEGALTINIGDMVQVWSNDRYKAALHRVVASLAAERFSAPFFFNPGYTTNYAPLPSTMDVCTPSRYHTINWGQFRALRAAGDFADQGEEIQISHYRTNA